MLREVRFKIELEWRDDAGWKAFRAVPNAAPVFKNELV